MEGVGSGASAAFAGAQKVYKFTSDEQFRNEVIVNTVAFMVLMNAAYCIYQYRLMQSFVMLTASTTFLMYRDAFVLANIRDTAASLEAVNTSLVELTKQQDKQIKKMEVAHEKLELNISSLESKLSDFATLNEGGMEVLEGQREELKIIREELQSLKDQKVLIAGEITSLKLVREQLQQLLEENTKQAEAARKAQQEQAEAARKAQEKMDAHLAKQMQGIEDREAKLTAREEALSRREAELGRREQHKV